MNLKEKTMKNKNLKRNKIRMKEVKKQVKGITLIALVVTIIVLLILAGVAISLTIGQNGIFARAQNAVNVYEQATTNEQSELGKAEGLIDEYLNGNGGNQGGGSGGGEYNTGTTVEEAKNQNKPFEDTTTIIDDLENPVTVPGGFNIAEDSGTKVEEGIVIEDSNNNQFVWIPVGEYNVSTNINSTGKLTNELSRREWASEDIVEEAKLVNGDDEIDGHNEAFKEYYYGEGDSRSVAKDQIDAFKTSSITNRGFYIGRYEAGTEVKRTASTEPLTIPLVQANKYPYIHVTRDQAKQQAEAMYSGNIYVTSQLISSYAWDTALNYICQTNEEGYLLATTTDNTYGNLNSGIIEQTGSYIVEGKVLDKYSNIFDVLGNCFEWTTEYSSRANSTGKTPCVVRGGNAYIVNGVYAAIRYYDGHASYSDYKSDSFRLQLYINPKN